MGNYRKQGLRTRHKISFEERLRIIRETRRLVDLGISKYSASLRAGDVYWQNVQMWLIRDHRLWGEFHETPYPYPVVTPTGKAKKENTPMRWPDAVRLMRQGKTIKPEGSFLYRYSIENGKLVEHRRGIYNYDWHQADVTLTRQQVSNWLFEEVTP